MQQLLLSSCLCLGELGILFRYKLSTISIYLYIVNARIVPYMILFTLNANGNFLAVSSIVSQYVTFWLVNNFQSNCFLSDSYEIYVYLRQILYVLLAYYCFVDHWTADNDYPYGNCPVHKKNNRHNKSNIL